MPSRNGRVNALRASYSLLQTGVSLVNHLVNFSTIAVAFQFQFSLEQIS
jgi:hypothetical protein